VNKWIKPTKTAKNKDEIGKNHKVQTVSYNSFGILIDLDNSEDEEVDTCQIIEEYNSINRVVKELEIKNELHDIELTTTQPIEAMIDKLVLDQVKE
jgi:hypothetical protein